jgi:hypothetical protein
MTGWFLELGGNKMTFGIATPELKTVPRWVAEAYDEKIEWFEKQGLDYVRGYLAGVGKVRCFLHRRFNEFGDVACAEMALENLINKDDVI